MMPVYSALHFIPMLLFKRQALKNAPLRVLLRTALGTARSATFLGAFVGIYQCESRYYFEGKECQQDGQRIYA